MICWPWRARCSNNIWGWLFCSASWHGPFSEPALNTGCSAMPMAGDIQILTQEYAQNSRMARYLLQRLPKWTCLVMETLTPQQRLYHYTSNGDEEPQTSESQSDVPGEKSVSDETLLRNCAPDRPQGTNDASGHIESQETPEFSCGDES